MIERDGIHAMKISPEAAEKVVGVIFPADEGATPTLYPGYPGEEALNQANVACNGLTVGDLAWAAYCGWNGAARSSHKNPQHRFEHMTGRNWLPPSTSIGDMLLCKMLFECVPTALSVSQKVTYAYRWH
jgi:hypothetical protein